MTNTQYYINNIRKYIKSVQDFDDSVALNNAQSELNKLEETIISMTEEYKEHISDNDSEFDDMQETVDELESFCYTLPDKIYGIDNMHDMGKLELFGEVIDKYTYFELKELFKL